MILIFNFPTDLNHSYGKPTTWNILGPGLIELSPKTVQHKKSALTCTFMDIGYIAAR
jgi:hypothetical protein